MLPPMDIQTIWIIVAAVSTPIAGVVGFAIQLRQVRKTRLENEKLQLEIAHLRAQAEKAESRIHRATTAEVLHFSDPGVRFSRRGPPTALRRSIPPEIMSPAKPRYLRRVLTAALLALLAFLAWSYWEL